MSVQQNALIKLCDSVKAAGKDPQDVLLLLQKLLGNIKDNPREPKFRVINCSIAKLQQGLLCFPGSKEFLATAGFEEKNGNLELPDKSAVKLSDAFGVVLKTSTTEADNRMRLALAIAERPSPTAAPLPSEPAAPAGWIQDPRGVRGNNYVGVLGFYYPDREESWDRICQVGFLGNFWNLGTNALTITPPGKPPASFMNAEAAFQALKFWGKAAEFRELSGDGAFQVKKQLAGTEDWTYAGFGSNWAGMLAVLRAKFQIPALAEGLKATGDRFLVEHNAVVGRDEIWSDNSIGNGTNWLGLQLMIVRDELNRASLWTSFINSQVDAHTGAVKAAEWTRGVSEASKQLNDAVASNKAVPMPADGLESNAAVVDADMSPKAAGGYGTRGEPPVQRALTQLIVSAKSAGKDPQEVLSLLQKLLGNIKDNPSEEKYRTLNTSNPKLQQALFCLKGAKEFLAIAGFEEQSGRMELPSKAAVKLSDAFQALLKRYAAASEASVTCQS